MRSTLNYLTAASTLCLPLSLSAHCQMPCGIYHDDMVFDQVDQYIETMVKGITVMQESPFATTRERNEFIRWVMTKDHQSDEIAQLITAYFLQQKIKPDESDSDKRLKAAHKLLFLIVQIKQNVDIAIVKQFYEVWEEFKLMFHIKGYECEMEKLRFEERYQKEKLQAEKEREREEEKQKR